MIAQRFVESRSRIPNPRAARTATQRRMVRKSRARYAGVARVSLVLFGTLALLMSYVVLTSSLTGLSYAVGREAAKREALQEETMRLDDRIAALRSDDRLAALAAKLGMREPEHLVIVKIAQPHVARAQHPKFPVLSSLAGFFAPAVAAQP
jgi:cell division protein FtsL